MSDDDDVKKLPGVRELAPRIRDLTGLRFGRLVVKDWAGFDPRHPWKSQSQWVCACDCGKYKVVLGQSLTAKKGTRSCGCLVLEHAQKMGRERAARIRGGLNSAVGQT